MDDALLDLVRNERDLQILELLKQDSNKKSIKVTALIRLERYLEALTLVDDSDVLQKSYCLLKLNRLDEALHVLQNSNGLIQKLLMAQVLNKLEKREALDVYKELEEDSDVEESIKKEIRANAVGVMASLGLDGDVLGWLEGFDNFEQAYNYSTLLIGRREFEEAERVLGIAENILSKANINSGEMMEDLELIKLVKLQKSVILQNKGFMDKAREVLETIDVQDINTKYVLKRNLSRDSIKHLDGSVKLTLVQKKVVEFNQLLKDTKHYKSLRKREENDENYQRLQVGLIVKEKKGMQEIKNLVQQDPKSKVYNLALVQLFLEKKDFKGAKQVLKDFLKGQVDSFRFRPCIVALSVFLADKQEVLEIFKRSLQFWKLSTHGSIPYRILLEKSAQYKQSERMYQEAAVEFQELLELEPKNEAFTAGLMTCYAGYDPIKAQGFSLPQINIPSDLDVDKLEDFGEFLVKIIKNKRKRKRKLLYPKNYDVNATPDPERWLPKSERSGFKKKKGKKEITGLGSQGSIASELVFAPKSNKKKR